MPGRRLVLTSKDNEVLSSFFINRKYSDKPKDYYKLLDRWKSTNEIANDLQEYKTRTKNRLSRLRAFGLLETRGIPKGTRWDTYWYISDGGIYYIMAKLKRSYLRKFLQTNEDKREISFIKELLSRKKTEVQVDFLINQIKNTINQKEFNKISKLVYLWMTDTFGKNFVRFPFLIPDFNIRTIRSRW